VGDLLLVTGGTRSGKSRYAVERARAWGERVLYVATCQPADAEMRERVRRHRAERPPSWLTLEPELEVCQAIQQHGRDVDGILLDCLTLYVSHLLMAGADEHDVARRVEELCRTLRALPPPAAIVTNEVGWGVVPETPLGRRFRDAAGRANQVAAGQAQEVVLLVCGLPLLVKGAGAAPPRRGRGQGAAGARRRENTP
jgi:adenosylcobinamide kinase/adenosylcobinamide-phosphate guanylyltransferase